MESRLTLVWVEHYLHNGQAEAERLVCDELSSIWVSDNAYVPIVIDSESETQRRTVLRQAAVGPSA